MGQASDNEFGYYLRALLISDLGVNPLNVVLGNRLNIARNRLVGNYRSLKRRQHLPI